MRGNPDVAVDRRAFLGLLAAAGGAALVGCQAPVPRGGSALGGDALAALLPAHRPVEFAKPDLPGVNGSVPGYLSYPAAPVRAVRGPVLSADVTAMTPSFWPPAPGLGQNSYYDAVNERLGGAVKFETVSGADYQAKLAALMAARQVADYPMLANIPTDSWHACVRNGRLHGVPYPGQLFPEVLFYRDDVFEQLGVEPPRSAEEFAAMAKQLNDPANNRWALGDVFRSLVRAFGGRGDWVRDDSGTLLNQLEAPWYAEAVRFTRSLYDAGCVHPDIVAGNWNRGNELFASRRMVVNQGGMGAWAEQVAQQRPADPGFRMTALPLFAHDGGEPTYPVAAPTAMVAFVREDVPDDRVRELLRLCDFAAAPIGAEEHRLLRYGVEGVRSRRDERGNPALTPLGQKEITLTYGFAAGPPEAITTTDHPDLVRAQHAWYAREWGHRTKPLAFGLRVEEPPEFATLAKEFADRTADILRGRAGLSEVDGLGERWRKAGGDRLREFYDKALRDAGR